MRRLKPKPKVISDMVRHEISKNRECNIDDTMKARRVHERIRKKLEGVL